MDSNNLLNTVWQNYPSLPILDNGQIHVWSASLDLPSVEIDRLATFLSNDETARANKFHFAEHKKRFIAAKGIIRQLLGNYLKIAPEKLEFEYGDYGKPKLATSMRNSSLQFNISHSFNHALYGFTNHHSIGVDLEYLRAMANITGFAKRFFTHQEFQSIANLPNKERQKAFFQLWTAKEAYLKATGTGLSKNLTDIELSLDDRNLKLLAIRGNMIAVNNWSMYHFVPAANYVATIIVNTQVPKQCICFWN